MGKSCSSVAALPCKSHGQYMQPSTTITLKAVELRGQSIHSLDITTFSRFFLLAWFYSLITRYI